MTMIFTYTAECFICSEPCEQDDIASITQFDTSCNLDTRQIGFDVIPNSITRCQNCGYCATQISQGYDITKETIRSEKYLLQLNNNSEKMSWFASYQTNSFLCSAIIQEEAGNYSDAGWSALSAAWICDGEGDLWDRRSETKSEGSISCRKRAMELFLLARAKGDSFSQEIAGEEAILADLYRICGQFEKVKPVCDAGMAKDPIELVKHVLTYQIILASRKDTDCHTIDQAIEHAELTRRNIESKISYRFLTFVKFLYLRLWGKFELGTKGPGGGIIIKVNASGSRGLEVQPDDCKMLLSWPDARKTCKNYGRGWRLPTKDELNLLHENISIVDGYTNNAYWSSSAINKSHAWGQYIKDGFQYTNIKKDRLRARAVRSF